MLKINLLPVRQLQKIAYSRRQFFGLFGFLLLTALLLLVAGYIQNQRIASANTEIIELQKEKKSYDPILAKINKFKKEMKEFERKTAIIKELKKDSSLTVRVLDEVADRIDNKRMWLTSLQQQENTLRLSGVALDNQTIAQFMDNLKASPFVNEVELADASLKKVSGRDLKSFTLNSIVSQPDNEQVD